MILYSVAMVALLYFIKRVILPILKQVYWRRYYTKFSNVYVSPQYVPLVGEFYNCIKDVRNGKYPFTTFRKNCKNRYGYDIECVSMTSTTFVSILSDEAKKQFVALVPHKVDRLPEVIMAGKLGPKGIAVSVSSEQLSNRKKVLLNMLDLNKSSKHIPIIIDIMNQECSKWVIPNTSINIVDAIRYIDLKLLRDILFGKNQVLDEKLHSYITPNNTTERIDFITFYLNCIYEKTREFTLPIVHLFPFLSEYRLINPFIRNHKNRLTLFKVVRDAVKACDYEKSVVYKIKNQAGLNIEDYLDDMQLFMTTGPETLSYTLANALYLLKKHPESLNKLISELKKHGIDKDTDIKTVLTPELLNEIDYLTFVAKEVLRYYPTTIRSLKYINSEDVEICGVKIPKGQKFHIDNLIKTRDPSEWHDPEKFIPERFDCKSELFFKPGTNKPRSLYCSTPFSLGPRV